MRSITTLTIKLGGCGMQMAQRSPVSLGEIVMGEMASSGTLSSLATATMAFEEAAVAVPIKRSTLFSSTSLGALGGAVDALGLPSRWWDLSLSPPACGGDSES